MRKDILIIVNSENNKVKIDNKTLGITSENLQGKIIFKPEPFVDGVCRLYVDGKGSILMDKQEDCYTVNILSSLLTEDSLDVCFKITEPETEDGIPIFCSKIMHFRVLETIDSSSTIPEDYPSWEQVLDSMMAKVEQMESDAEDRLDEVVGQIQDLTSAYNSNATNKTNEFNTNATNKTTAFNQNYASKVTEIDGAVNSAKTELDDYTEDKKDEIDGSVDDLKSELDTYETAKEGELDSHTSTKKTELNTYTNSKKSDLDDYEETKETALNTLAGNLTSAFNSNANSKTSDFNDNATSKTGDFNTNATNKTTDFNTNATNKTSEFDQNAEDKTDDFDDNASEKTTAFNNNATAKIAEYDAHVSELQSQVDDLTTLVETELESNEVEGTEIDVSDSAEYRGKVEVKGNTEQEQLSGKNLYGISDYEGTFNGVNVSIQNGIITLDGTATSTGVLTINPKKEQILDGNYAFTKNLIDGTFEGSANLNLRNASDSSVITEAVVSLEKEFKTFTLNNTSVKYGIYIMFGTVFNNYKIGPQIVVGSTPDYNVEPYCGGQASPNPDYPQEIKVVTGDNVVKHVGKNLLNIADGTYSNNGITAVVKNGKITLNGTATKLSFVEIPFEREYDGSIISLSANNSDTVGSAGEEGNYAAIRIANQWIIGAFLGNRNATRTAQLNGTFSNLTIRTGAGLTYNNFVLYPQLEIGQPTSYEPNREEEYELSLGNIELCKIGNYQDIPFKNVVGDENYNSSLTEGAWYKKEIINKRTLNSSEIAIANNDSYNNITYASFGKDSNDYVYNTFSNKKAFSNVMIYDNSSFSPGWDNSEKIGFLFSNATSKYYWYGVEKGTSLEQIQSKLNGALLYTVRATAKYTQITNPTLISQLEALRKAKWFKGINHWWTETENLEPVLKGTYKQSNNIKNKERDERLDNLESRLALLE